MKASTTVITQSEGTGRGGRAPPLSAPWNQLDIVVNPTSTRSLPGQYIGVKISICNKTDTESYGPNEQETNSLYFGMENVSVPDKLEQNVVKGEDQR